MRPGPPRPWASRIGPRLEAALGLLAPCHHLVDVGTDHGLVPLAAVQRGLARRATGVDRRPAPLREAARTLQAAGEARVVLHLGDGLRGIDDADAVVATGLGAGTIIRVLQAWPPIPGRQCVLGPLTEAPALRRWARLAGWRLADEACVAEGPRHFLLLRLVGEGEPGGAYDEAGWSTEALEHLGPVLLRRGGAPFRRWLEAEAKRLGALSPVVDPAVGQQLGWVRQALDALGEDPSPDH